MLMNASSPDHCPSWSCTTDYRRHLDVSHLRWLTLSLFKLKTLKRLAQTRPLVFRSGVA